MCIMKTDQTETAIQLFLKINFLERNKMKNSKKEVTIANVQSTLDQALSMIEQEVSRKETEIATDTLFDAFRKDLSVIEQESFDVVNKTSDAIVDFHHSILTDSIDEDIKIDTDTLDKRFAIAFAKAKNIFDHKCDTSALAYQFDHELINNNSVSLTKYRRTQSSAATHCTNLKSCNVMHLNVKVDRKANVARIDENNLFIFNDLNLTDKDNKQICHAIREYRSACLANAKIHTMKSVKRVEELKK